MYGEAKIEQLEQQKRMCSHSDYLRQRKRYGTEATAARP